MNSYSKLSNMLISKGRSLSKINTKMRIILNKIIKLEQVIEKDKVEWSELYNKAKEFEETKNRTDAFKISEKMNEILVKISTQDDKLMSFINEKTKLEKRRNNIKLEISKYFDKEFEVQLQAQNQELEDKNKRIAELEEQLKRESKVNSDEFIDKKELKKKIKELKQKAKDQGIGKKFLKKII
ncbi:hypothetical protein [Campylobacter lanienae]|uniref:hypothetical protein n=1 Tax=Campylobacter lanienae TaxID=75658 RepID=UPI000BB3EBCF|nr:hypothetical protein [Campylobacter lanienae]